MVFLYYRELILLNFKLRIIDNINFNNKSHQRFFKNYFVLITYKYFVTPDLFEYRFINGAKNEKVFNYYKTQLHTLLVDLEKLRHRPMIT